MTLAEFLAARIAEDEAVAQAATPGPWEARTGSYRMASLVRGDIWIGDIDHDPDGDHIARHDPARVLAECEAKRRIVDLAREARETQGAGYGTADAYMRDVLRLLALPYSEHRDYDDGWRP